MSVSLFKFKRWNALFNIKNKKIFYTLLHLSFCNSKQTFAELQN